MAIVNVNSISGINSITAQSTALNFYTAAGNNLPISAGALNVGTGASISSPATNVLVLGTNNSERVRINSSGNVGVGTNNPTEKTHVYGSGDIKLLVETLSSGLNANSALQLKTASEGNWLFQTGNAVSGGLRIYDGTAGAERIRVSVGGSLGIGESSPDLPLHVSGTQGYPASTGSVPTGFISLRRKSAGGTHGLHIGVANVAPYGSWLQAQDANSLGTNYPLLLNPNGGSVGVGTINPSSSATLSVQGSIESVSDTSSPNSVNEGGQLILRAPAQAGGTKYRFSIDNYYGTAGTSGNVGQFRFIRENDGDSSSGSVLATLDESGRLRLPSQPAFRAVDNVAITLTAGSAAIFPSTSVAGGFNTGGHYSTSTGRFTAPVAGVYYFQAMLGTSGWSVGNTTQDHFTLRVNNNAYVYSIKRENADTANTANGYFTDYGTFTVYLNANDYVTVVPTYTKNSFGNSGYTWFEGFLLG